MLTKQPMILVFAGPNGSGKSFITEQLQVIGAYVNADDIKRATFCSDLEAAIEATELREQFVKAKKDFTFETVLSTKRNMDLLKKAKEEGYFIKCFFILTVSAEVNKARCNLCQTNSSSLRGELSYNIYT